MESNFVLQQEGEITKIILQGRLDAAKAPQLMDELKKLIGKTINQIVFIANDLEYISSAGIRVILFTKQKIGVNTEVYFIAPQPQVLEVLKMSGLDNFLFIQEKFEE
jgi:anti-anti-sigma factor